MYVIVGLGNPEEEYAYTRHNMGFDVINTIAKKSDIEISRAKFNGLYGSGMLEKEKVILLKPQTYMNLSGECIKPFLDFYKLTPQNLIVIYDDIDTLPGTIRIRKKGGPGTHNGMKSVVHELLSDEFIRIRVGIGSPQDKSEMISYVIGKLEEEEYQILQKGVEKAAEAVIEIMKNGVDKAMNRFNGEAKEDNV